MSHESVRDAVSRAAEKLGSVSRDPRRDAQTLLGNILNRDRTWLLTHDDASLSGRQQSQFNALLARRSRHEPIQYILGETEFYGLRFAVTPAVLIPRPETEHLVEAVLARIPANTAPDIADVGTGSGAISIALAHHLPLASIDALDISSDALAVAHANAAANRVRQRIRFHNSDLLSTVIDQTFDVIVSNPPYVPANDELEAQVAEWEPHSALFAGEDGLAIYRQLIPQALHVLRPGGFLALEIGAGQREAIATLFAQDPQWTNPEFIPDLQGIPRVAIANLLDSKR